MSFKARLVSDVHLEFADYRLHTIPDERDTVLIIAGDLVPVKVLYERTLESFIDYGNWRGQDAFEKHNLLRDRSLNFLSDACARHKKVLWVFGNHEFYGYHFKRAVSDIRPLLRDDKRFKNLQILERSTATFGDVVVIGATLYTDFNNGDEVTLKRINYSMNDFHVVWEDVDHKTSFTTMAAYKYHVQTKAYIINQLRKNQGKKCIVVSHHAPSFHSIDPRYVNERTNNHGYASNLDDIMTSEYAPMFWCHGHVHCVKNYGVGDTRILCNPRGYNDENWEFNPTMTFGVDDNGMRFY